MAGDKEKLKREQGLRLKEARERAGYESATDAAKDLGVSKDTYIQHESGIRGFKARAEDYAAKLKVSPEWLLWGKPSPGRMAEIQNLLGAIPEQRRALAEDLVITTLDRLLKEGR